MFNWIKYARDKERKILRQIWEFFPEIADEKKRLKSELMREIRDKYCLDPAENAVRLKNYAQLERIVTEYHSDITLRNQILKQAAAYKEGDILAFISKLKLDFLDWNEALRAFMDNGYPGIDMAQMMLSLEILIEAGASMDKIAQDKKEYGLFQEDTPLSVVIEKSCFFSWAQQHCKEFTLDVRKRVLRLLINGGPIKLR